MRSLTPIGTSRESVSQLSTSKADAKTLASGTNLDDLTTRGLYGVHMNNATGTRPQTYGYAALIVTKYDEYRIAQICAVTDDSTFTVYIRMSKYAAGSRTWNAWKKFTLS